MASPTTINPDDFLSTPEGRVWTPERNEAAWALAFAELERAIRLAPVPTRVVLVCGLQGAGKSTWISRQPSPPATIYFDAALPAVRHRAPVVEIAKRLGAVVDAVWIATPLSLALERNLLRPSDQIVPAAAILAVARQFERPTAEEGFDHIHIHDGR